MHLINHKEYLIDLLEFRKAQLEVLLSYVRGDSRTATQGELVLIDETLKLIKLKL